MKVTLSNSRPSVTDFIILKISKTDLWSRANKAVEASDGSVKIDRFRLNSTFVQLEFLTVFKALHH